MKMGVSSRFALVVKPIEDIFGKHFHSDEVLTMLIELHAKGLAGMPYVLRRDAG